MNTDRISIIFLSENLDKENLIKNLKESPYDVFAIRFSEASTTPPSQELRNLSAEITTILRNLEYQVFLEVLNFKDLENCLQLPTIVYLTENTNKEDVPLILEKCKENRVRIIYRVFTHSLEKLSEDISFYNSLSLEYENLYFFIRPISLYLEDIIQTLLTELKSFKNVYLLDIPLCLQKEPLKTSSMGLLDLAEQIERERKKYDKRSLLKRFYKVKEPCLECESRHQCFGIQRDVKVRKLKAVNSQNYSASLYDILSKPSVNIVPFNPDTPSEFGSRIFEFMQKRRLLKNFKGEDFYYLWDWQKSFFFNRPLEPCALWQEDPRGLKSVNWQFIGKGIPELEWKQKCDLLMPQNGFSIASKVRFNNDLWPENRQRELDNLTFSSLKKIIIENGGDENLLTQQGNDLMYNGKKFAGKEWQFIQNVGYIENTVVTCSYIKEKEWFDKLYHWSGEKQITGITDEVPAITKELLLNSLYTEAQEFFSN